MLRNILLCGLMVSVMTTVGCAKREGESPRADTAKAGLMPTDDSGGASIYLADQKQVAMAGEVSVSLEPLETFRNAKSAEQSDESEASDSGDETDTPTSAAADDDEWAEEDEDAWGDEDTADEKEADDKSEDDKSDEETSDD